MLNPEERKILAELPQTQYGVVLFKYLEEQYTEIGDIMKATPETLIGKQESVQFLKKLFAFMEKPRVDTPRKNQYN